MQPLSDPLDPSDGTKKRSFATNARVQSSPAVGFDGTIYFGSDDDNFYAITPSGNLKWSYEVGQNVTSSAAIAPDGTVYFGGRDNNFYALRSSSAGLAASTWPKKQRDNRNTGRFGSDVTRRQWYAPHVYWLSEDDITIVTVRHTGGSAGNPVGTTASFNIEVRNRDGSLFYALEDSLEPGETKDIVLQAPQDGRWAGSVIVDAPIKDGTFLAPFLTWQLTVKSFAKPLQIGAFFSDPTEAALVHHFPAEANADTGLGLGVQNIGENEVECSLEFFNENGTLASDEILKLNPKGSLVQFFNSSVPNGFKGSATFSCDAPVVVIAVTQDAANGGFVTDRLTIKGLQ